MKTVLVALDFPAAEKTLETSIALAKALGARLVALHVVRPPITRGAEMAEPSEEAALRLARLQRRLRRQGITVETRHVVGQPAPRIVELASLLIANYVVIGAHDRGPAIADFLSGTATQVLREAPCPVVVVRPAPQVRSSLSRRLRR